MPQQRYRHHRVAKKNRMPQKGRLRNCLDYLTECPVILWALIILHISLIKSLFCRHR